MSEKKIWVQRKRRSNSYSPGFVTQVVDGVQGVDGGDSCVLQTDDQVPEVLVLRHAEGMLTHQHKVGPERSGGTDGTEQRLDRVLDCSQKTVSLT